MYVRIQMYTIVWAFVCAEGQEEIQTLSSYTYHTSISFLLELKIQNLAMKEMFAAMDRDGVQ